MHACMPRVYVRPGAARICGPAHAPRSRHRQPRASASPIRRRRRRRRHDAHTRHRHRSTRFSSLAPLLRLPRLARPCVCVSLSLSLEPGHRPRRAPKNPVEARAPRCRPARSFSSSPVACRRQRHARVASWVRYLAADRQARSPLAYYSAGAAAAPLPPSVDRGRARQPIASAVWPAFAMRSWLCCSRARRHSTVMV